MTFQNTVVVFSTYLTVANTDPVSPHYQLYQ